VSDNLFVTRLPVFVSLAGIAVAWLLFVRAPGIPATLAQGGATAWIGRWWRAAWGFDWLYDRLLVRPFVWLARLNRQDFADRAVELIAELPGRIGALAAVTQNGRLRYYAAVGGLGACILIAIVAL